MQNNYQQLAKRKLIATCVTVLVVAGLVVVIDHLKSEKTSGSTVTTADTTRQVSSAPATTPTSVTPGAAAPTPAPAAANTSGFKDGTFTASSSYYVPHSRESIRVQLTLKNGVVTNSNIVNSESDPESASFQEDFAAEYVQYVVGKKISDIHLSYVAGASDTTQGFNDALDRIISEAQA